MLAILFCIEVVILSLWVDGARLVQGSALLGFMAIAAPWILRIVIGAAVLFVALAYLNDASVFAHLSGSGETLGIRPSLLVLHGVLLASFAVISWALEHGRWSPSTATMLTLPWVLTGIAAMVCGACAFVPLHSWIELIRRTGKLWMLTLGVVVPAAVLGNFSRWLWQPTVGLTFALTRGILSAIVHGVISDPSRMMIGTRNFKVIISPECSGLEGMALMLAFGGLWLWVFRREYRFPRSLLLLPVGVVTIFLLNSVRIAALVLIGDAGAPKTAAGGFHSQAGWIAFTGVALAFTVGLRHVSWIRVSHGETAELAHDTAPADNGTAAYLMPFLLILAAGMVARAASADFEWLYPLRFVAALAALWVFRRKYSEMDWRCDGSGPLAGAFVFALWVASDRLLHSNGGVSTEPSVLLNSAMPLRIAWIFIRALAAVVTVPIAEELAFRGYLTRRLMSSDFESVSVQRFTWRALIVSSLLFGALHGGRWIEATIAGLLYGLVLARRGRIGDAIAAHATTNALLAVYVVAFGQWKFW